MFHTFAGYEERVQIVTDEDGSRRVRDLDEGTLKDLRSAITSAILVFCEALRFKSICSEAVRCLRSETYLTPISKRLQDLFSKACIARASLREVRVKIQGPGNLTASCHRPTSGGTQTIITGSNGGA
jgi:hypothetical protein